MKEQKEADIFKNKFYQKPVLIGISGKPGSGKNYFSFKILQELRYQDYNARKGSLASAVYTEVNELIDFCQLKSTTYNEFQENFDYPKEVFELAKGSVGERNIEWGYNRRNENVRKVLSSISQIKRQEDENIWVEKMMENSCKKEIPDFLVFSDMRYPNEADFANIKGITIRIKRSQGWIEATKTENDGYKYSKEGMEDPIETALDDYPDFHSFVKFEYFNGKLFTRNLLRELGYSVKHQG